MDINGSDSLQSRMAFQALAQTAPNKGGDRSVATAEGPQQSSVGIAPPAKSDSTTTNSTEKRKPSTPELAYSNKDIDVNATLSSVRKRAKTPPIYVDTFQRIQKQTATGEESSPGKSSLLPNTRHNPGESIIQPGHLVDVIG